MENGESMSRETAREIDAAAAAWAARVDRGLSSPESEALDAWLAVDTRRAGAYARARAVALHTERARALGADYDPNKFAPAPRPILTRRGLMVGGGAIAASTVAAVVGTLMLGSRHYATERGGTRVVPLEDGSVVTLNTASKMSVRFSKDRRDIRLSDGEALFDVAKDRSRPFVVAAGDTLVRAVGTSFTVRYLRGGPVQVLVREGVVEVTHRRADSPAHLVRLTANTRAAVTPQDPAPIKVAAVSADEVGRELAWKDGRLAFEGETLSQAAAEFARYSDTRIVIDDPALAREAITGLYQSNDPVGFARAAALALNARAEVRKDEVVLSR